MTGSESASLADRLARVEERIDEAVRAAGRARDEVSLIVVTKFQPASLVRDLAALGVRDVGENRHQEAHAKQADVADAGLRWHFIGQLQTNKARAVREYAASIHSIDRASVVRALDDDAHSVDGFIQVNLTDDPGRGGVAPAQLEQLTELVVATPGIRLRGVMAVAPLDEDPRAAFARLRALSERVQRVHPDARAISAGMSTDLEAAVAEGATHLRIGSAITGPRPTRD